jgi:glycine/D-amino acid oxidase-like deaminating enzyme
MPSLQQRKPSHISHEPYDVVIIGGGFYGCCIALYLHTFYANILLIEREQDLLTRASLVNQARIHNGYHYPRSYLTALRSHINFPRFVLDFQNCVDNSFTKLYAIARTNSKVSAYQFRKMFSSIGAPVKEASSAQKKWFNPRLIEEVFCVEEYAFDAVKLRAQLRDQLAAAQIPIWYDAQVERVNADANGQLLIKLRDGRTISATKVLNCTYAGLNRILRNSGLDELPTKYELAEVALIAVPPELQHAGVTLMDGPFFSVMPFPSRQLHSLTHVRYTPHQAWTEQANPDLTLNAPAPPPSKALYMLRDAARYMPLLASAQHVDSLFEYKTILLQNEQDDGRPILFRNDYGWRNHALIMGGKIDNIYDIFQKLSASTILPQAKTAATT